jgi:hypothetical protein
VASAKKLQRDLLVVRYDRTHGRQTDNAIFKTCGSKHYIPIDFDVYSKHGPFYPNAIAEDFIPEITFNDAKYVVTATDVANIGYTIINLCIKYETVHSPELARQIEADYMNWLTFYYDYVTYFKIQTTGTDKTMNINVNIPRRSMKGVLVFFQKAADAGEYDSESTPFQNPDVTDVQVTIEGLTRLAFSGCHLSISVRFITQKYNAVVKDFRDNIRALVQFYEKDEDSLKAALSENGIIPKEQRQGVVQRQGIVERLKKNQNW